MVDSLAAPLVGPRVLSRRRWSQRLTCRPVSPTFFFARSCTPCRSCLSHPPSSNACVPSWSGSSHGSARRRSGCSAAVQRTEPAQRATSTCSPSSPMARQRRSLTPSGRGRSCVVSAYRSTSYRARDPSSRRKSTRSTRSHGQLSCEGFGSMSVPRRIVAFLDLATQDAEAARTLAATNKRYAAYHCQQAAEKLIKAVLLHRGAESGTEHRLDVLVDELPDGDNSVPVQNQPDWIRPTGANGSGSDRRLCRRDEPPRHAWSTCSARAVGRPARCRTCLKRRPCRASRFRKAKEGHENA